MYTIGRRAGALLGFALAAAAASSWAQPAAVVRGDAELLSGGIGHGERARLLQHADDFDLLVTFARKSDGAYLSGVTVRIDGPALPSTIELTSNGPLLFGKLPAGDYTLTAELADWQPAHEQVTITAGQLQQLYVVLAPDQRTPD